MKQVHVRRHAPKHATGQLTDEGALHARGLRAVLGTFDLVISSDKPRAVETATLLTGTVPVIDPRAGTPPFSPEEEQRLHLLGERHPLGIAGVIMEDETLRALVRPQGERLMQLIRDTFVRLPDDGRALIISHDGVMVTAYRLLQQLTLDTAGRTFRPLEGFLITEDGRMEELASR